MAVQIFRKFNSEAATRRSSSLLRIRTCLGGEQGSMGRGPRIGLVLVPGGTGHVQCICRGKNHALRRERIAGDLAYRLLKYRIVRGPLGGSIVEVARPAADQCRCVAQDRTEDPGIDGSQK